MLEQYKKTFWSMQLVIGLVTFGVLAWSHLWDLGAAFFCTMQLGAVAGAMWGVRLKNRIQRLPFRGA